MTPKENMLRVLRHDAPEWVPNGLEAICCIPQPVEERPEQPRADVFGVIWDLEEGAKGGTYPALDRYVIRDLSRWCEQITIPTVEDVDWVGLKRVVDGCDRKTQFLMGYTHMGLFERSCLLLGMENALMAYLAEPKLLDELLDALADYKIRQIEAIIECFQPDMYWYGDDWGHQHGLFLPPDVWRRSVKKHTKRIFEVIKGHNLILHLHSCGKIEEIFADVIEIGVDVWNPCQPCNRLASLKDKFGDKITFCGGIDSQFVLDRPGVTPEEVRAEVRARIDQLAVGGGYIASPSHSVPYDQELLDAMNNEIATYGRTFYTKRAGMKSRGN